MRGDSGRIGFDGGKEGLRVGFVGVVRFGDGVYIRGAREGDGRSGSVDEDAVVVVFGGDEGGGGAKRRGWVGRFVRSGGAVELRRFFGFLLRL